MRLFLSVRKTDKNRSEPGLQGYESPASLFLARLCVFHHFVRAASSRDRLRDHQSSFQTSNDTTALLTHHVQVWQPHKCKKRERIVQSELWGTSRRHFVRVLFNELTFVFMGCVKVDMKGWSSLLSGLGFGLPLAEPFLQRCW